MFSEEVVSLLGQLECSFMYMTGFLSEAVKVSCFGDLTFY